MGMDLDFIKYSSTTLSSPYAANPGIRVRVVSIATQPYSRTYDGQTVVSQ